MAEPRIDGEFLRASASGNGILRAMADQEIERLTPTEMLTFAGLLRKLIRMDGRFTEDERDALGRVALEVAESDDAGSGAPYRGEGSVAPIGETKLFERIDQSAAAYPDDQKLREAALAVTRQAAREAMHALLFEVAASDVIGEGEGDLLEWLEEKWQLEHMKPLEGEDTLA